MKLKTLSSAALAVALLFGYPAMDAAAQSTVGAQEIAVPTTADIHIERGLQLFAAKEYGKARKEYRAAVELMRADGLLPEKPLYQIAFSFYREGKHQKAVSVLDGLAREAAEAGEVSVQAVALADAAWVLWQDCLRRPCRGGRMALEKRQQQVQRLLSSPYLTDAEVSQIASRVGLSESAATLAKAKAKAKRARMRRT